VFIKVLPVLGSITQKVKSIDLKCRGMNITAVGFGQAGGKIVDKFLEYEQSVKGPSVISNAVAVNSAKADLMGIDNIPDDRKLLIGQAKVKGHGVGADNLELR
jgi:cell division GTPase FtsZ